MPRRRYQRVGAQPRTKPMEGRVELGTAVEWGRRGGGTLRALSSPALRAGCGGALWVLPLVAPQRQLRRGRAPLPGLQAQASHADSARQGSIEERQRFLAQRSLTGDCVSEHRLRFSLSSVGIDELHRKAL